MASVPRKQAGKPTNRPNDDRLIQLYIYERKTSPELAAMFDVSPSTIRNWIARLRRKAEAAGTMVPKREPKSKS